MARSLLRQDGDRASVPVVSIFSAEQNPGKNRRIPEVMDSCPFQLMKTTTPRAASSFLVHDHEESNHQGLDNQLIDPAQDVGRARGEIKRRERLGGILRYYFRQVA